MVYTSLLASLGGYNSGVYSSFMSPWVGITVVYTSLPASPGGYNSGVYLLICSPGGYNRGVPPAMLSGVYPWCTSCCALQVCNGENSPLLPWWEVHNGENSPLLPWWEVCTTLTVLSPAMVKGVHNVDVLFPS